MLLDTKPAIERDPQKQIDFIKDAFQNFETKFQAFGPIIPSDQHKDKSDLVERLQKSRKTLFEIINKKDLSEICLTFKHGVKNNRPFLLFILDSSDTKYLLNQRIFCSATLSTSLLRRG